MVCGNELFHWDAFSRHIYITTIVLWLNFVCKTGYCTVFITSGAQDILVRCTTLKGLSMLLQWCVPRIFIGGKKNARFCIGGIYNRWWNSTIDDSIMTRYFPIYIMAFIIKFLEASHNQHFLFSLKGILRCTVQWAICWYTWNHIVGITFELWWSDYGLGRSIRWYCAQQRNTHLWFGNA